MHADPDSFPWPTHASQPAQAPRGPRAPSRASENSGELDAPGSRFTFMADARQPASAAPSGAGARHPEPPNILGCRIHLDPDSLSWPTHASQPPQAPMGPARAIQSLRRSLDVGSIWIQIHSHGRRTPASRRRCFGSRPRTRTSSLTLLSYPTLRLQHRTACRFPLTCLTC